MTGTSGNRRALGGDPARLSAAAAVLRAGTAERIFGSRFPGEYVMLAVAKLLDAVAWQIRNEADLDRTVVSAATEIADHVLTYASPPDRGEDPCSSGS